MFISFSVLNDMVSMALVIAVVSTSLASTCAIVSAGLSDLDIFSSSSSILLKFSTSSRTSFYNGGVSSSSTTSLISSTGSVISSYAGSCSESGTSSYNSGVSSSSTTRLISSTGSFTSSYAGSCSKSNTSSKFSTKLGVSSSISCWLLFISANYYRNCIFYALICGIIPGIRSRSSLVTGAPVMACRLSLTLASTLGFLKCRTLMSS